MPGFYRDGEYDVAGFIVGVVERTRVIDGRTIAPGDVLIGLRSRAPHERVLAGAAVLFETAGYQPDTFVLSSA